MGSALIAVTLVSLGMAVAMGVVTWRLLQGERRRSAARVEALAALAARSDALDPPLRRALSVSTAVVPSDAPAEANTVGRDLFAARDLPDGQRRHFVFAAAFFLVTAVVAALVALGRSPAEREPVAPSRTAPLELLSLRHAKQDEALTISGLVLNPSDGRELRGIVAVAFVFDQAGQFLGSGRAPIEFSRLAPGAESPFQITVAKAGGVGRYRISFRTDDGGVLGHVDRRARAVTTPSDPTATPARTSSGRADAISATSGGPR